MSLTDPPAPTSLSSRRPRFPAVSVSVPVILSVALALVFQSPYALIIGVLGPVMALGSWWESRRSHRVQLREDQQRAEHEHARVQQQHHHEDEQFRRRLDAVYPDVPSWVTNPLWRPPTDHPLRLRIGRDSVERPSTIAGEHARLVSDVAYVVNLNSGIAVVGHGRRANGVFRAIVVQSVALWLHRFPGIVADDTWFDTDNLPTTLTLTAQQQLTLQHVSHPSQVDPAIGTVVVVSEGHDEVLVDGVRVDRGLRADELSSPRALWAMRRLRQWRPGESEASTVRPDHNDRGSLWCRVDNTHWHDLATQGPHALVWGQSGRGKTFLLHSLLVDLAERYPAERLSMVVIDFKGGAGARAVEHLPHLAGVLTDLEPESVRRVQIGIEAEITRRESLFAQYRVADIAALPQDVVCPRTIIAIDEVALLVERQPAWASLLGDIASRGRSLGLHLVVSGQRITAQVPRSVIVNAGLRWCLGVADPQEAREYLPGVAEGEISSLQTTPAGHVVGLALGHPHYRTTVARRGETEQARGIPSASAAAKPLWAPALPENPTVPAGFVGVREDAHGQCLRPVSVSDVAAGLILLVGDRGAGVEQAAWWLGECVLADNPQHERLILPDGVPFFLEALDVLISAAESGVVIPQHIRTPRLDRVLRGVNDAVAAGVIERLLRLAAAVEERGEGHLVVSSRPGVRALRVLRAQATTVMGFSCNSREQWEDLGLPHERWLQREPRGRALWLDDLIQWPQGDGGDGPDDSVHPLIEPLQWPGVVADHPQLVLVSDRLPEALLTGGSGGAPHRLLSLDQAGLHRPLLDDALAGDGVVVGQLSPALLRPILGHDIAPLLTAPEGWVWWVRSQHARLVRLDGVDPVL